MSSLPANVAELENCLERFRGRGILNRIGGRDRTAHGGATFDSRSPVDGSLICSVCQRRGTGY